MTLKNLKKIDFHRSYILKKKKKKIYPSIIIRLILSEFITKILNKYRILFLYSNKKRGKIYNHNYNNRYFQLSIY